MDKCTASNPSVHPVIPICRHPRHATGHPAPTHALHPTCVAPGSCCGVPVAPRARRTAPARRSHRARRRRHHRTARRGRRRTARPGRRTRPKGGTARTAPGRGVRRRRTRLPVRSLCVSLSVEGSVMSVSGHTSQGSGRRTRRRASGCPGQGAEGGRGSRSRSSRGNSTKARDSPAHTPMRSAR